MPRALAGSILLFWVGSALVLSRLRWFTRRPLAARLRPFEPGGIASTADGDGVLSISSFRDVVGPAIAEPAARLSAFLGVQEDAATRLRRIHSAEDLPELRVRQVGWMAAGAVLGALLTATSRPPLGIAMLFMAGAPLLAFLLVEQQLIAASDRWKRRVFLELPSVSEQLGMLLGAGFSLGGALNRLAARSAGVCGRDLVAVCGRIRQGLTEVEALREWADRAGVDALDRLVGVLALNRETGDLGRLVAEEARGIRRDVHRELLADIERRSQQVWIPVTVATLVPGALLLAIPFIEALRLFSST